MVAAATAIAELRERLDRARLYCVTPDWDAVSLGRFARAVLVGGVDVLQLRHKHMARGELLAVARELRAETARFDRLFIVNDHLDIALLSGADGVHLGPDDIAVDDARTIAGDQILIGASASSPNAALDAEKMGADYIGCGPFAPTVNKPEKRAIGAKGIAQVAAAVRIPVFAIGGITHDAIARLRGAGIDRVCVISALADASDPEKEARRMSAELR